jgi:hypothetical protein
VLIWYHCAMAVLVVLVKETRCSLGCYLEQTILQLRESEENIGLRALKNVPLPETAPPVTTSEVTKHAKPMILNDMA